VGINTEMTMIIKTEKDKTIKDLRINKFEDEIDTLKHEYIALLNKHSKTSS